MESKGITDQKQLWLRGGSPRSLLAPDPAIAYEWMQSFVKTYLEKDFPLLGFTALPPLSTRSSVTIKNYIDFLENAFLVRRLYPFGQNIRKRIVKSPKLYFTDTGILHYLLNLRDYDQLLSFPAVGNSWEAFCIQQILSSLPENCLTWHYRSQDGAECDLII
jgi:predicted AAA+ superfamily ATPase